MDKENESGYLARAWADLTSDDRWWQVILALGFVNCIPVIGQIFTMGYLYDWAKEAAWGMHRPMSHEVGDIKRRGKYGLIWLAITLAWTVPVFIVARIVGVFPGIGAFLRFLCDLILIVAYVVSAAAVLRGLIYERVLPGLQFDRMLKMARQDVPGLARVFCIGLIVFLVAVVALLLVMIPAAPFAASVMGLSGSTMLGLDMIPVLALGIFTIVVSLFVWIAATVCSTVVLALFTRAIGYWVGQFEPGKWGSPHDDMPFEEEDRGTVRPERGEEEDEEPVEDGGNDDAAAGPEGVESDAVEPDGVGAPDCETGSGTDAEQSAESPDPADVEVTHAEDEKPDA